MCTDYFNVFTLFDFQVDSPNETYLLSFAFVFLLLHYPQEIRRVRIFNHWTTTLMPSNIPMSLMFSGFRYIFTPTAKHKING